VAAVALALPALPQARANPDGHPAFHIPSLDGLRAASFLLVFASHAGLDSVVPGAFGVTVFFFLSGYLITTLMRAEFARTGRVGLGHFYLRRALRILPPFYIVLGGATALAALGLVRGDLRSLAVASEALHVSNYWFAAHGGSGVAEGTGVFWSLAVEEHFYLLYPAIFLLLCRVRFTGRQKAFAFWTVCGSVLAWRCVLVFLLHADVERLSLCSDTRIDSIAFGCALAVWNNPVLDGTTARIEARRWPRAAFLAGVALLLVTFVARGPAFRETIRYTLQGIGLTPIFVSALRYPGWPIFRLLNARPMRFVGALSYSLYLVHHVVLRSVQEHLRFGGLGCALVALVVSLSLAWALQITVEKPCARLRRRLAGA
jgi:peptidoglycan/LPS O-acetylase OafA/YrhL